jgi:hypothetical protein
MSVHSHTRSVLLTIPKDSYRRPKYVNMLRKADLFIAENSYENMGNTLSKHVISVHVIKINVHNY